MYSILFEGMVHINEQYIKDVVLLARMLNFICSYHIKQ